MGPVLVRVVVVAFAVASASVPGSAQGQRQLEFTVLGGTAHTDRSARLITEESVEPFAGVRVGARLRSLWGGQAGVVVQWDRYGDSRSVRVGPPCLGICTADARIPVPDSLVDLHMSKSDERFMVGGSWSRPIISWLRADILGLVGMRRADSSTEYAGLTNGRAAIRRGVVGGELGLSTQWRSLVTGAGFHYSSGSQWGGVRRGQNRVMLRVGYALPLGAE